MVTSPIQQRNLALATEYLEWQRKRNRSAETLYAYTDVLHKMVSWMGETPSATVPTRMLEAFVERPRARRRAGDGPKFGEAAPATRRRDITSIRSFFRYLIERGYIAVNPALAMVSPQVRNVAPKAIDDDTWRAVWCHPRLDDTERFVLGMAFFCGLRRRELVDLNAGHFAPAEARPARCAGSTSPPSTAPSVMDTSTFTTSPTSPSSATDTPSTRSRTSGRSARTATPCFTASDLLSASRLCVSTFSRTQPELPAQ